MIDFSKNTLEVFCGYPIFKIKTGETLNEDELKFFKSLTTVPHFKPDVTKIKLTKRDNILNNIELKRIKALISECFFFYVDNILEVENQFYMCNSWGTSQKKDDYHPNHTHRNAMFSSAFYIHAENSSIIFNTEKSKIQEGFFFEYNIKNFNIFNSISWEVPVKTGDIIIFPGQVKHHTPIMTGSNDRMIIGSNFFLKGKLGTKDNYNLISI
jgi:hypothetical protein